MFAGVVQKLLQHSTCLLISTVDAHNETLYIACSPESLSMASFEGRFVDDVTKLTFTNVSQAMTFNLATLQLCISDNSMVRILQIINRINTK